MLPFFALVLTLTVKIIVAENGDGGGRKEADHFVEMLGRLRGAQEREKLRQTGNEVVQLAKLASQEQQSADQLQCSRSKYRSFDGTCNNLLFPRLGSANSPLVRLPGADIDNADRISKPRKKRSVQNLPGPRKVSQILLASGGKPSSVISSMALIWGQYLSQDISLTAPTLTNCNSIFSIHEGDTSTTKAGVNCTHMRRDAAAATERTNFTRAHPNIVTSYIDASNVYGGNESSLLKKRSPQGNATALIHGMLRSTRLGSNKALEAMHEIAVGQHNRLARSLKAINPLWKGDKVFQEARKINCALHQHITYNEFIPQILDKRSVSQYDLTIQSPGCFYTGYNETVNPSSIHGFATAAAIQHGHSQTQNHTKLHDGSSQIIPGSSPSTPRKARSLTKPVQGQELSESDNVGDLPAIIQHGRDQGLPGYNKYRSLCGLHSASSFEDFKKEIPSKDVAKMAGVYKHPDDVDLFVGGMLERRIGTGAVGPTFSCLLGEQFRRLRRGDRFWYENEGETGFTANQLNEIRKISLASLLCEMSDGLQKIKKNVMSLSSPEVLCKNLPTFDLSKWKDHTDNEI